MFFAAIKIENTDIENADSVSVAAKNIVKSTGVMAAGAASGVAAVSAAPIINVFNNTTQAFIDNSTVKNAATSVKAYEAYAAAVLPSITT